MNTARIIRIRDGMLRVELHSPGDIIIYHFDSNDPTDHLKLIREIADWCERTPDEGDVNEDAEAEMILHNNLQLDETMEGAFFLHKKSQA